MLWPLKTGLSELPKMMAGTILEQFRRTYFIDAMSITNR